MAIARAEVSNPHDRFSSIPPEFRPSIETFWGEGAMIVNVAHASPYVATKSEECRGKITMPLSQTSTGSKIRTCSGCGQDVTVVDVRLVRADALEVKRLAALRLQVAG